MSLTGTLLEKLQVVAGRTDQTACARASSAQPMARPARRPAGAPRGRWKPGEDPASVVPSRPHPPLAKASLTGAEPPPETRDHLGSSGETASPQGEEMEAKALCELPRSSRAHRGTARPVREGESDSGRAGGVLGYGFLHLSKVLQLSQWELLGDPGEPGDNAEQPSYRLPATPGSGRPDREGPIALERTHFRGVTSHVSILRLATHQSR